MSSLYLTEIAQLPLEIDAFCEILKHGEINSFLEIGSKYGGSLWRAANALPLGSRIVSVDLPSATSGPSLTACVAELNRIGYQAQVIWGDSKSDKVLRKVHFAGPYDAIMIDADHRLPGLTADWLNYGPMSRKLVAFHDISWWRSKEWVGGRIDVPQLWNSIKHDFRHQEIKLCPTGKSYGIGVLWK